MKSRQHRILRVLGAAITVLAAAVLLLHTPPAKNALRRLATAAAGGNLELEELDYRLWLGEVRARGVVWTSPSLTARVPEASYRYSPFGVDRIEVRSPEIRLSLGRDEGAEPAGAFAIPAFLLDAEVSLRDGSLQLDTGDVEVSLSSLGIDLSPSLQGWRGEVAGGGGAVALAWGAFELDDLRADVLVTAGAIRIREASVTSGASSVSAAGAIDAFSPFEMTLDVSHDLQASLLDELREPVPLSGSLRGDATLRVDPESGFEAEGELRSEALVYGELEPVELTAPWSYRSKVLAVRDAVAAAYGGDARVSAAFDFERETQSVEATLEGVALSRIEPRLGSRLSGEIDLRMERWDTGTIRGDGDLALAGDPTLRGVPLEGSLAISMTDGVLAFEAPRLRARGVELALDGRLGEALDARFRARASDLAALDSLLRDLGAGLDEAPWDRLAGSLSARGALTGPLDAIAVSASVESSDLSIAGSAYELDAALRWSGSRLELDRLDLRRRDGGVLHAEGVAPTGAAGSWRLSARADALDLDVVAALTGLPLDGSLEGEARVTGAAASPDVEAVLEMRGFTWEGYFEGDLSAKLRRSEGTLIVDQLVASREDARLELTGRLDPSAGRLTARATGGGWRLGWIPPLAAAAPGLEGTLSRVELDVEGPLAAPEGHARLQLDDVSLEGTALPSTTLSITSDGERARLEAHLPEGERLLEARVELTDPYLAEVRLDLQHVPWAPLLATLEPLEGTATTLAVEGTAELSLPLSAPRSLQYRLEASRALATYRDVVFGASAPFSLTGDLEQATITDLNLIGSDTAVGVDGVVPLTSGGAFDVTARGAIRLELLELWVPEARPAGLANATLHLVGTLSEPRLQGDLVIEEASATVSGVAIENVNASARWIDNVLLIEEARGTLLDGTFELRGEIAPRPDGELYTRLELDVDDVALTELLEGEAPRELRVSISGRVEGEGRGLEALEGGGTVDAVRAETDGLAVESDAPAPWSLAGGVLELPRLRITGGPTDVLLSAEARPFADPLEWSARLEGVFDHGFLSPALSESGLTISGLTRLDVSARGGPGGFAIEGSGSWSGARIVVRDPPLAISDVSGRFELTGDAVRIVELGGDAGGGRVRASGELRLSGTSIEGLSFQARAERVRLSYPEGLRSELDADLTLTGSLEAMRLAGTVELERAVFSRNINIETELLRSFSRVTVPSAPSELGSRVALDLQVRADDALRVDNNLAQLGATANLTITGTVASPELYGVVSTQQGGRFRFGRNVYQIETGSVQFRGYPQLPPEIDVTARTSVAGHDLRLTARGVTDNLVTSLDAPNEPNLTRADVASLLVTGRTVDKISTEGRTVLGEQMASYLGATLADLAQLGLGEALPFQIVTTEPALIAREVDPGARFTIGAAFTDDLTLVYSIGLNDAEAQIWLVDYGLPKSIRAQVIRREDNDYTFGVLQQIPFDFHGGDRTRTEGRENVGSVAIVYRGEDRPEVDAELRESLRPRPGSRYDYWRAWEQADRIRRALREEGYLEATVDVATSDCGESCVEVRYLVDLGPPVAFLWEGEVDEELGDALAEAWDGRLGESFLTSDLEQLAEGRLFARGYFVAQVEASTQRTDQGLTVRVRVHRGPRGERVAVKFTGNEGVSGATLAAVLPGRRTAEFYDLLTAKRPRLKQLLRLEYATFGYLGAEIQDPELHFDEAAGELQVTIPVVEGPPFRVEAVELEGVGTLDEGTVRSRLPFRQGDLFRATDFVDARAAIASYYRRQGFPDVHVEASVLDGTSEGALRARFVVEEGERATVGTVTVAGNDATREGVIRREVVLDPGEPLRLSDVSETQKNLYELDVFRSAEVVVGEPGAGTNARDVTVRVVEAPDLRFDYGLRAGTDGFLEVLGEVNAPNVFGRAHHAGFRTLLGTERKIFRFNYHSPYLSRYRLSTDFFLERAIEDQTPDDGLPFQDRTWRFTAQQTRPIADRVNAQWSYSFRRTVTELDDPIFGPITIDVNRPILSASIIGDSRDSVVRPTQGLLWSATLQGAPKFLRSYAEILKVFGQLFAFVPLGDELVWASAYRMGAANSFGARLVADDRFQAGGSNTMRGFAQGSLGPVDDIALEPIGGSGLIVVNQEIRFPLFWRLRGTGFWDAGNVFATASDVSLTDLRHDVGLGARLELGFGLLRLDWAWVVGRREGEDPWRLVFSLGHAF